MRNITRKKKMDGKKSKGERDEKRSKKKECRTI